jgi:ligand-binding SRPBCC domain-containing protein
VEYVLEKTMFLPLSREQVFDFFSDAGNLARITPPGMGFQIKTPGPIEMRAGTRIEYRIRVFGLPLTWRSLISRWDPPNEFVDEQLRGPYRQWIHTHRFRDHVDPVRGAGTLIEDEVRYRIPGGPLGRLLHPLVRRELEHIFRFRQTAIEAILLGDGLMPRTAIAPSAANS